MLNRAIEDADATRKFLDALTAQPTEQDLDKKRRREQREQSNKPFVPPPYMVKHHSQR